MSLRFEPETNDQGNTTYVIDRVPIYYEYKINDLELISRDRVFTKEQMLQIMEALWHLINRRPSDNIVDLMKIQRDLKYWDRMKSQIDEWDGNVESSINPFEVLTRASWKLKYDIDTLHNQSISCDRDFYGQLETAVVNFLSTVEPLLEKN